MVASEGQKVQRTFSGLYRLAKEWKIGLQSMQRANVEARMSV